MCEFCQNHEQGDTLYESSDWDGGIGFDYIRDIKYCPICGKKLNSEDEPQTVSLTSAHISGDIYHKVKTEVNDNQKVKADYGKAKLSLVPRRMLWDVAAIREYGNCKYPDGGPDNWKHVDVTRYRDAAFRHFLLYLDDPHGVDEESGLPHLWHLACNVAFLCDLEDDHIKEAHFHDSNSSMSGLSR